MKKHNTVRFKSDNVFTTLNYVGEEIRVVYIDGEPWVVLKDICSALALSNPYRIAHRYLPDIVYLSHIRTMYGKRYVIIVPFRDIKYLLNNIWSRKRSKLHTDEMRKHSLLEFLMWISENNVSCANECEEEAKNGRIL